MFNGIIYNTGKIYSIDKTKKSLLIGIKSKLKFKQSEIGSSICCDGVCLTLINIKKNIIFFYVSNETLNRSNFRLLKVNQIINLEKSILYGKKISGHFTQGHVDVVAKIKNIKIDGKTWIIKFQILDENLTKFLMEKA
jgi:riboflavin synthase